MDTLASNEYKAGERWLMVALVGQPVGLTDVSAFGPSLARIGVLHLSAHVVLYLRCMDAPSVFMSAFVPWVHCQAGIESEQQWSVARPCP